MSIKERVKGFAADAQLKRRVKSRISRSKDRNVFRDSQTYILTIEGQTGRCSRALRVEYDDRMLYYREGGSWRCVVVASKPITVNGGRVYFTKDGMRCTLALNKYTLLKSDAYTPAQGKADEKHAPEPSELEEIEGYTDIEITGLEGSKRTLYEATKAKILQKMLREQKIDKKQLVFHLAGGALLGIVIAEKVLA